MLNGSLARSLPAEPARRALDGQRQQSRPDHLHPRRHLLDGGDDRLEQAGVAIRVASQHDELGTPGLGLAAAQTASDPGGAGDGGAGEHLVGHDDRRGPVRGDVRGASGGGDRPARRPEREHPHGAGGRGHRCGDGPPVRRPLRFRAPRRWGGGRGVRWLGSGEVMIVEGGRGVGGGV